MPFRESVKVQDELKKWLVRRVECIRGEFDLGKNQLVPILEHFLTLNFPDVEVFPAFDYARAEHTTEVLMPNHPPGSTQSKTVSFSSGALNLQLDVTIDRGEEDAISCPCVDFRKEKREGMLGEGVVAHIHLVEGQAISFILRDDIPNHVTQEISTETVDQQQHDTQSYWINWISHSKYKGRWREVVNRSLMILKLLTYEPTGAIVAAPTFSIPEHIGGGRQVDYQSGVAPLSANFEH